MAAAAAAAALPAYAPRGVTDPTRCFAITLKKTQCMRKPAAYDCVCSFHTQERPAGAPLPCPPGHIHHPEPAHFDKEIGARLVVDLETARTMARSVATLRTDEANRLLRKIYRDLIDAIAGNPEITHPLIWKYCHPSHQWIASWKKTMEEILSYHNCWMSGVIEQNTAMQAICRDLREMRSIRSMGV
jgi:hypothetical protein